MALPASCRRLRALWVSNDDSSSVTPAFCSRAAFSRDRPEGVERRDVRQRLHDDGDFPARKFVGDHPSFRGADENQPELELVRDTDRGEQVARAVGLNGERDLAAKDRSKRFEVQPSARVVAPLRGVPCRSIAG